MTTAVTWSGSQALRVREALKTCIGSNVVEDYYTDEEKDIFRILLEKAELAHALAITHAMRKLA